MVVVVGGGGGGGGGWAPLFLGGGGGGVGGGGGGEWGGGGGREQIMSYDEDTAGSLMVKDYVALAEDVKAKEVIEALQNKYLDVEMPFYIYVIDAYGKLVGVSSLRQLVVESPDRPLKEFMATDIVSVKPYTDREEVARLVSRYDYLAIPVVDDDNRIVGIVTVDDVIDILHEAATEDMLKMAGVGEEYVETQTIIKGTRIGCPGCLQAALAEWPPFSSLADLKIPWSICRAGCLYSLLSWAWGEISVPRAPPLWSGELPRAG